MVDGVTPALLETIVKERIAKNRPYIEHSLRQIDAGNPLGAETEPTRLVKRISAKTELSPRDSAAVAEMITVAADQIDNARPRAAGPEAIIGPTIDYVGVEFLSKGRLAANAVGRVVFRGGRAQGTGFMIAPRLFITNNHVLASSAAASEMLVDFDYEASDAGGVRSVTSFAFDPEFCFVTDDMRRLDFTIVGIGQRVQGDKALGAFGHIPLSDAADKHMLGEIANIIQHPLGKLKQIVVRENNLVSRDETVQVLHYLADTEPGASGSPVCNSEWEPIAIHHWGGPGLEITDPQGRPLRQDINEGVRISAIVKFLRAGRGALTGATAAAITDALARWDAAPSRGPATPEASTVAAAETAGGPRLGPDGSMIWSFPIEISVRSPLFGNAAPTDTATQAPAEPVVPVAAERTDPRRRDFSDRGGYEPGFIPGFTVPLPGVDDLPYRLARNQLARQGDDPHELRYHHFSIMVNAERRLAAFTACNIDGERLVAVNREDKTVNLDPTLRELGVEAFHPESTDDFSPDPRVDAAEQMAVEFYEEQRVPGHEKPPFPGRDAPDDVMKAYYRAMSDRTARMFQKGHITLRGDPAWGLEPEAVAAEADTFFYTNAAPQLGFFNQGSADNRPGSKGKLRWRAVESYVLRNAFVMRQRISVFAGPIFDDDYDVPYRFDSLVPMRFWKIAVWAEAQELRCIALLADQKEVLLRLCEGVPEGAEAFTDEAEEARLTQFLSTVAEIERRTGLDFGAALRDADVRKGSGDTPSVIDAEPETLRPTTSPRRRRSRS